MDELIKYIEEIIDDLHLLKKDYSDDLVDEIIEKIAQVIEELGG